MSVNEANPTDLDLLRQRITELEAENVKLRQIIEDNTKREAENTELKSKVGKLEARLAILEQSPPIVNGQPQNDLKRNKEVSSEVSALLQEQAVDVSDTVVDMSDDVKLEQDSSVVNEQSQDAEDEKVFLLRGFKKGTSRISQITQILSYLRMTR